MTEATKTSAFSDWLDSLRDNRAKARIIVRIERLEKGNAGDAKPVGEGVSEMRIDYGPGYRVYYLKQGKKIIVLLCGGDKSTQEEDIKDAKTYAKQWKEQQND